jgi:hypothetical protein
MLGPLRSTTIPFTRLKETVMNTDKVIELGKVSEETKGGNFTLEHPLDYTSGPDA